MKKEISIIGTTVLANTAEATTLPKIREAIKYFTQTLTSLPEWEQDFIEKTIMKKSADLHNEFLQIDNQINYSKQRVKLN